MSVLREYAASVVEHGSAQDPAYDEIVDAEGTLRPVWRRLLAEAGDLSTERLAGVRAEIERLLADEGAVYTPPGEEPRAWRLDPLPLVLSGREWSTLEKGLAQRAELLEAILGDLYGPRHLLAEQIVPAAAVLGHEGYVRALARPSLGDPGPLVVTGVDLGRGPTGEWQVLADRTQAPSGIGFAMENRRVLSRVLPAVHRAVDLHRLAPFFGFLRTAFARAAPPGIDDPRIVLLSPGAGSETAYDQAFIAAALGLPLVEGGDLTVRDGRVFVRVLGRLEQVDVIVRRVDAAWTDPLELRGDSRLGVAGLTEAVRRGTVTVVNSLGAGVLENPALLPFMSAICERLLDEPLRLSGVPTVWAGTPEGREEILDRRDELVVRTIDPPFEIDVDDRRALESAIAERPHRYVGQERAPRSVLPVLTDAGLRPHEITLRAFTIRQGSSHRPMIGGLATATEPGAPFRLGVSKDVWVLKESPDDPDQGIDDQPTTLGPGVPAPQVPRVLDDLFWLGRHAERTEAMVRLTIVTHALAEDFQDRRWTPGGRALDVLSSTLRALSPWDGDPADHEGDLRSVLLDARRVGSVAHGVARLQELAQSLRDQLSPDMFRVFGAIDRARGALATTPHAWQIGESAGRILTDLLALYGVAANMVRDEGWHLMEAGRAVERGLQVCHLVGPAMTVQRGHEVDREVLGAVLQAAESAVTHRRRHRGVVRATTVAELLLLDEANPRSLRHALTTLDDRLAALAGSSGSTRPERLVDDLLDELARVEAPALLAIDGDERPNFARFARATVDQLMRVADAVAEVHVAVGPAPRSLGFSGSGS